MNYLVFIQRIHIFGKGAGLFYLCPWLSHEIQVSVEAQQGVALCFSPGGRWLATAEDIFLVVTSWGVLLGSGGQRPGDCHTPHNARDGPHDEELSGPRC